jgi:signal transduction histidine kinase/HAMP domain-containing protein
MKLQTHLWIAQAPLLVALGVTASLGAVGLVSLGAEPAAIVYENSRTIDAMDAMLDGLGDVRAAIDVDSVDRVPMRRALASMEEALALQEQNVTERGETDLTRELRTRFERLLDRVGEVSRRLRDASDATAEAVDAAERLRVTARAIRDLNRRAMAEKSELAKANAEDRARVLAITVTLASLVGVLLAWARGRRLLRPIAVLDLGVRRLAQGDLSARVRVSGSEEIAALGRSFNAMAEQLETYRRSSVGELVAERERLTAIMNSLADAVIVFDADQRVSSTNARGRAWVEAASRHPALRELCDVVRETGEPKHVARLEEALELVTSEGTRYVLAGATPFPSPSGQPSGVTLALRDVTSLRRIDAFKRDLVSSAAHELRTPLTSVQMSVHLCLEGAAGPVTERQTDLLDTARRECERLQSIVDDLLELARLERRVVEPKRAPFGLDELVTQALARAEDEAGRRHVALGREPGPLLTLDADAERLRHVIDNLLANAIRHARERVIVAWRERGDAVRIEVRDDGPGIPMEHREKVFELFHRVPGTEGGGAGLGLAIVREVVASHGGEVGAENAPEGGACVWFEIPSARVDDPTSGVNST